MGNTILKSLKGGQLERHLEFLKMLNDASWASFGFFNNNMFPNRITQICFTIQYNAELFLELTGLYLFYLKSTPNITCYHFFKTHTEADHLNM